MRGITFKSEANLPFGSGFVAFGCRVNSISVDTLFKRYEECGFLYPEKLARLRPHWNLIKDNWARTMSASPDEFLHYVIVYEDSHAWSSLSHWRATNSGGHAQHLVSLGDPTASRAVMLSSQSEGEADRLSASQNWFRAKNRFPTRVLGTCVESLGSAHSDVRAYTYLMMTNRAMSSFISDARSPSASLQVRPCQDSALLSRIAEHLCGPVLARTDEWADGDVELSQLDQRFRAVGLRRYRRVFVAFEMRGESPVGFAIAYRGPLGLNFSFLENRCELWLHDRIAPEDRIEVAGLLLGRAAEVYEDFELPYLLIACDPQLGRQLLIAGGTLIQDYTRSVWLRDGFPAWYDHVNSFYQRLIRAKQRRPDNVAHLTGPAS